MYTTYVHILSWRASISEELISSTKPHSMQSRPLLFLYPRISRVTLYNNSYSVSRPSFQLLFILSSSRHCSTRPCNVSFSNRMHTLPRSKCMLLRRNFSHSARTQDHYKILGVPRTATKGQIKKRFYEVSHAEPKASYVC